jgi:hypothetical protein
MTRASPSGPRRQLRTSGGKISETTSNSLRSENEQNRRETMAIPGSIESFAIDGQTIPTVSSLELEAGQDQISTSIMQRFGGVAQCSIDGLTDDFLEILDEYRQEQTYTLERVRPRHFKSKKKRLRKKHQKKYGPWHNMVMSGIEAVPGPGRSLDMVMTFKQKPMYNMEFTIPMEALDD